MQHRNYQKEMEQILQQIGARDPAPRLLLHSCCAPCRSYVLEYLSEWFEIEDLFYNPNIAPEEEYRFREEELKRLIREMPLRHTVQFIEGRYEPECFYEAVRGEEEAPEGGERCRRCFALRLTEAARKAKELGCEYFTTTLSISPLKHADDINEIGERIAGQSGVRFLPSDFKKKDGYQRSIELSREYDLYRQNYCGCVFSRSAGSAKKEGA